MVSIKGTYNGVKSFAKKPDVMGQLLAGVPRLILSLGLKELPHKIILTAAGIGGNILNEKTKIFKGKSKDVMRAFFTNMMMSFSSMGSKQAFSMKQEWADLKAAMKSRSFNSIFGAIFEEPAQIVNAIKTVMPKFSGFKLPSIKLGKKEMGTVTNSKSLASDGSIKEITPKIATRFGTTFKGVSDKDLVTW